ncbi:MAG: sugar phosphate nucleotidyltransferase [Actinomycetota bacterium]
MKALILAGGLGTRLRPLTYTRPKHILPIANRPHIEHVFDLLKRHDVAEVVLLTSYLPDAFGTTLERAEQRGIGVEVALEPEPLGTAGALKNAEGSIGDGTFLAFNGDVLTDVDLGQVVEFHRARGAVATIVLTPVDDPSAYGVVPTAADGRVLGFIEKPAREDAPTNLINAGVYVFEPAVLDHIPVGRVSSAERELFPALVADGAPVYALGTDAYWMDIGTPQKYLQANLDALAGRFVTDAVGTLGGNRIVVGEDAEIASDARVFSACVGAGARIEAGCEVAESVLLPMATVGAGAVVRASILGEGARVGPGVHVLDDTIADGGSAE